MNNQSGSHHKNSSKVVEQGVEDRRGWWGAFAGVLTLALVALPLSAAVAFATHPETRGMFTRSAPDVSNAGYSIFWWVVALLIASLPFFVGFGIAKLSAKGIAIAGGVFAVFVIAILVLGQLFLI